MNDACVKFLAHSRAPLAKTKLIDLLDASDRARLEEAVQALDRGRGVEVLTLDVTFRLRNVRRKPARVQVALKEPTPAGDGGWLFVIQDTLADEREKAARDAREAALIHAAREASDDLRIAFERLRNSKRQLGVTRVDLRAIADNLPILIICVDSERRFQFANATCRDWLGLDPQQIAGRLTHEVLDPDYAEAIEPYVQRALNGERAEYELESKLGGSPRLLRGVLVPRHALDRTADG